MSATIWRAAVFALAGLLASACATATSEQAERGGGTGSVPTQPDPPKPEPPKPGVSKTRTLTGAQVIRNGEYTMVLALGTHDLNSRTQQGGIQ